MVTKIALLIKEVLSFNKNLIIYELRFINKVHPTNAEVIYKNKLVNHSIARDQSSIPIGSKQVFLNMKVQGVECKDCGCIRQENVHFLTGKRAYTNRFARLVVELSHISTIQDTARFLHISWDRVKEIQKRYLQRHYGNPGLNGLEHIGIDEFAVAKGHVYKTIVVNLLAGQVAYIGDGKGSDVLDTFWKKIRKCGVDTPRDRASTFDPQFIKMN